MITDSLTKFKSKGNFMWASAHAGSGQEILDLFSGVPFSSGLFTSVSEES